MVSKIREASGDTAYWCDKNNQFGALMKEYNNLLPTAPERKTLEKVSVTVSSNIHLNSFMYEPIIDLHIDSLIGLYKEIRELGISTPLLF